MENNTYTYTSGDYEKFTWEKLKEIAENEKNRRLSEIKINMSWGMKVNR